MRGPSGRRERLERDELRALGVPPGAPAVLLQFSTAFCAPCRATRRVLDRVAALLPGVVHLEVDAESHLDLVRRLDVRTTPTTLLLDSAGAERSRASGVPRPAAVVAAVAPLLVPEPGTGPPDAPAPPGGTPSSLPST